jgi:hypothetical protein
MPLQRHNALHVVPPVPSEGRSLDELLGPVDVRPGELHEPVHVCVPAMLRERAGRLGVSTSLALTVAVERQFLDADLRCAGVSGVGWLDERAARSAALPLGSARADYARMLMAALNGHLPARADTDACVVVPSRLADRVRSAQALDLAGIELRSALTWELASVRSGRTMTEWALSEALAARHPVSADFQDAPAASAAR